MPNAGELLNSLQETFGLKKKKPTKTTAAAAAPPVVVAEVPAAPETSAATPTPEPLPAATAEGELPDWLSALPVTETVLAPLPEPEAPLVVETPAVVAEVPVAVEAPVPVPEAPLGEVPVALPPAEAPVAPSEAKAESDPFATSREFNVYMEIIRQAQAVLTRGIALTPEEQRKALIAVARSNSLLTKLPPEVLKSVLLMRAVAANKPDFGRDDFQREMLAAMNIIKTGAAAKG